MSVAALGRCFETSVQAAAFVCASDFPRVVNGTSATGSLYTYAITCSGVVDPSMGLGPLALQLQRTTSSGGTPLVTYNAVVGSLPSCDAVVTWQDGAVVAWGIVAAWIVGYALLSLRKGL